MINEPFEPVSEPRACGWPFHGIVAERRVSGVRGYVWIAGGAERAFPSEMVNMPFDRNVAHKVRHPSVRKLDLTSDEVANEFDAGREWWDFASISGSLSTFYGKNLGDCAWIAVLDDNRAWRVRVYAEQVPITLRYRWVMEYSRTTIGPTAGLTGYTPLRVFSVELKPEAADTALFSPSSAQAKVGGVGSYGTLQDTSRYGDRAIIDNATIRVITTAELAAHGYDIDTVSGDLPIVFDAIVAGTRTEQTLSSYGRYRRESAMALQRYDLSPSTLATMPITEASAQLETGAVFPSSTQRVNSIDSAFPGMWIDYKLYDVPPRTEVETWETRIKAHLPEDASDGFVEYRVRSELTSVQTYSGQACAWAAFNSSGGTSPDFTRCPPPSLAEVSTTYTLKQIINYGDAEYRAERVWTLTEAASSVTILSCTPRPAAGRTTGNYSLFGVKTVPQAYSVEGYAFYRGRPASPGSLQPATWDAFAAPPYPLQPDASGAATLSIWNRNNFSMRAPVTDEAHMRTATPSAFQPIVARYAMVENYFVESMPAAAGIPKGLYYKGKMLTPWLPAYGDVWTMNPKTYEVHVFPRAPTNTADGYLNAIYV